MKFKETEFSFETEVTDGELDLFVYNAKRGQDAMQNPELSYIIVRAVPEYDGEMLAMMLEASGVSEEELKEYRTVTVAEYKESVTAAKKVADSDSASEGEIREAYENLKKAFEGLEKKMVYNAFTPGKTWQDTDGNKIQAHGGQVQKLTVLDRTLSRLKNGGGSAKIRQRVTGAVSALTVLLTFTTGSLREL